jgi:S-DNA-T family DNA segregation ATPase FtsK/SpoIIIE
VRDVFAGMTGTSLAQGPEAAAQAVLDTVVRACGQKVLGAGRSTLLARELIGLWAAVHAIERRGPAIWLSLDDSRKLFGLRGRFADMLGLRFVADGSGWRAEAVVVEAKCVAMQAVAAEARGSLDQVRASTRRLREIFVEADDPSARRGWGKALLHVLLGKPEFERGLDAPAAQSLRAALMQGQVRFSIAGLSSVAVHDDNQDGLRLQEMARDDEDDLLQVRFGCMVLAAFKEDTVVDGLPLDLPGMSVEAKAPAPADEPSALWIEQIQPAPPEAAPPAPKEGANTSEPGPNVATAPVPSQIVSGAKTALPPAFLSTLREMAAAEGVQDTQAEEADEGPRIAQDLRNALVDFGMHANLHDDAITITPNGTLVRFRGHGSLTVKKIEARLQELRTTYGLDVTDLRPGLGWIGLFVARRPRRVVSLARTWLETDWPAGATERCTSMLLGLREDDGRPLWLNLSEPHGGRDVHAPHTLIAGETGSGKGVLVQNILLQLIATNRPEALHLHLIDPKAGIDYFWIEEAPHLQGKIVTQPEEAKAALAALVVEMDRRYDLIQAARTGGGGIDAYNAACSPEDRLPRIVLVHDEMADWMAGLEDYRREVQSVLLRLAAKARACGIHVILVTQRAAQDAVPVGVRDNLGNRLCLKVASKAGSELALRQPGAERLLGRGHLAADLGGDVPESGGYFVVQVPFAESEQLRRLASSAIGNVAAGMQGARYAEA